MLEFAAMVEINKFGGTSLGNFEKISNVAKFLAERSKNQKMVVVVSAMAGQTNNLLTLCQDVFENFWQSSSGLAEADVVLATGEQVSSGLLSLALQALEKKACSWQGWQIPIITNGISERSKIVSIGKEKILQALAENQIPIVSGFQGISKNGKICTLGRGGSDTTAVALAAALNGDRCNIFTDVSGIYTADPSLVEKARKIHKIDFKSMLELAAHGAKVMEPRSIEIAYKKGIDVMVRSSFDLNEAGTLITNVPDEPEIVAIAYSLEEVLIQENLESDLFKNLCATNFEIINITEGKINFLLSLISYKKIVPLLSKKNVKTGVCRISLIGKGLGVSGGYNSYVIAKLLEENFIFSAIWCCERRISLVVDRKNLLSYLKILHKLFIEKN